MRNFLIPGAFALALGFAAGGAQAAWIISPGNTGSFNDDNVIESPCVGNITGPATTIQGCLNTSHTTLVNFTSDENLEYAAGGQAKIIASDGNFSFLEIEMADGTLFQTLILNIETADDGTVTFSSPGELDQTFALDGAGQNFFSISNGDFSEVSFVTSVGVLEIDLVDDVKQVRIGIEGVTDVPEPASLALFGAALTGLALFRRRRAA